MKIDLQTATVPQTCQALVVAEISKVGYEHSSFNAAVLDLVRQHAVPLYWLAHKSHLSHYSLKRHEKRFNLPVLTANTRLRSVFKYGLEFMTALGALGFSSAKRASLCFLSVSPTTLVALSLMAKWTRKPFTVLVHNELETLTQPRRPGFWHRQGLIDNALHRLQGTPVKIVCLAEHGTRFLHQRYPRLRVESARLPPTCLPEDLSLPTGPSSTAPVFGIVGTLGDRQINANIRSLCQLLASRTEAQNTTVRIKIIGGRGLEPQTRALLQEQAGIEVVFTEPAQQDKYLMELATCSCVLFLCSSQMYSVSASSVLVDCISTFVPVLSLPCNYARELADHGTIQVCTHIEQLSQEVLSLATQERHMVNTAAHPYRSDIDRVILQS